MIEQTEEDTSNDNDDDDFWSLIQSLANRSWIPPPFWLFYPIHTDQPDTVFALSYAFI